jgi:arylsulfatase A-like enzyme
MIRLCPALLLVFAAGAVTPTHAQPTDDKATKDANGFFVHQLESPYQSGKLPVRVLVPDRLERGKKYPVVYVLPVEAKDDARFGNGLLEIKKHNLHNTFQAVFVAPTFSTVPWYADHPTKPELRQESHLLRAVIPLIEKTYPVSTERDGRLLLGFSKSGVGANSLILRNPDTFGKALAFDAPLMRETLAKGSEVFATQENFEKYCVPKLLQEHAKTFAGEKRLILLGKGFLHGQHQQAHALMDKLNIAHEYREGTQRKHTWDSGWVPEAVELLLPKAQPSAAKPKDTKPEAKKPNVVLILADDMGYADVGCYGCKDIPTPHIDSIAKNGVRFTDAYASAPWCSPSRAGLLTGRYQQRFGYEFNPTGAEGQGLPFTEATLAERLKANGYATGIVGKWHLGRDEKRIPTARGFDEFFGFLGAQHSYLPADGRATGRRAIYRGTETVREPEYLTDALGREAAAFIDKHKTEPFFLYLSFNAVHIPMEATDKYLKRFADMEDERRRTYAAMLSAMDDAIGMVLKKLRDGGLEENTLVIFLSDHGGAAGSRTPNGAINSPLRGAKLDLYEGGIRVPLLLQWKDTLPQGMTYSQPVIHLDLFPTILAAAGMDVKDEWKLDGVNLLPHLTGESNTAPHDLLYWRMGNQFAVRKGNWKLVRNDESPAQLYDLAADIGETIDLSDKHPLTFKELETAWKAWNGTLAEPLWGGRRSR